MAGFADTKILVSNVLHPSSQIEQINLIDKTHIWNPFNNAALNHENNTFTIEVDTNKSRKVNNGASLPIRLNNSSSEPFFLTLDYLSKSNSGSAKFLVILEIAPTIKYFGTVV